MEVQLPDGTAYGHPGTLDFSDLAVDPGTGALSLRAVLPNPEHALLPGMFVNLRLTTGTLDAAYILPQSAVTRDSAGAYALTVDAAGKVAQRRLQTHGMTTSGWIVTGELGTGEQVIVEGLQKVQPGGSAKPVAAPQAAAPANTH